MTDKFNSKASHIKGAAYRMLGFRSEDYAPNSFRIPCRRRFEETRPREPASGSAGCPVAPERRVTDHYGVCPRDEVTEPEDHHEDLPQPLHVLVRRPAEADRVRSEASAAYLSPTYPAAAEADASGLIALTTGDGRPEALGADPRDPDAGHFPAAPEQLDAWHRTHWTVRRQGGLRHRRGHGRQDQGHLHRRQLTFRRPVRCVRPGPWGPGRSDRVSRAGRGCIRW